MRRATALVVAAFLAGACGGAADAGSSVTLTVIDQQAAVRASGTEDFVLGESGDDLAIGDDVRTDTSGFAEIVYPDGSLTRLDRDTEFRVVSLDDADGAQSIEGRLEVGRVWSRVKDVGDGSFEVRTATGTAAVRGTAFDVGCTPACLVRVLEGVVGFSNGAGDSVDVAAGQAVQVAADGTLGPLLALTLVLDDPWIAVNLQRDGAAGFAAIGDEILADVSAAGIGGTWDVRFVSTAESTDPAAPPGSVSDVTFTIAPACEAGPCNGTIDAGPAGTLDVVLVDGTHTIDDTEQTTTPECQPDPVFDRVVTGRLIVTTIVATAPERATTFTGTIREEFNPLPAAVEAGCAGPEPLVRVSEVSGVWRDDVAE